MISRREAIAGILGTAGSGIVIQETQGQEVIVEDTKPFYVLRMPSVMPEEAIEYVKKQWNEKIGDKCTLIVLPCGMDIQPVHSFQLPGKYAVYEKYGELTRTVSFQTLEEMNSYLKIKKA
ncbi:hypothetical protein C4577_05105 [Candidatus Parcubacteria bacterium]|nr:MAG: hypothetical protein C4577_05105 [Candidatus Parcubacteria bacterium]